MSSSRHRDRLPWLTLLLVCTMAGWFVGRQFPPPRTSTTPATEPTKAGTESSNRPPSTFADDSPQGLWIASAKEAAPADFPRLLEEWKTHFPEGDNYLEGRPEHALRWLFGMWLSKDPEGFLDTVTASDFDYSHWAAQALVRLMPKRAADMLSGSSRIGWDKYFATSAAEELAARHPRHYLAINPDGRFEIAPNHYSTGYDGWETAITNLAKTDPLAAADASLAWNGFNAWNTFNRAIMAVASAWDLEDPSFAEWTHGIADPRMRNFANHARLCAMAKKDPHAALAELYSANLERDNDLYRDAPSVILRELAKADPVGALELLHDVEKDFSANDLDPFRASTPEEEEAAAASPFSDLSPGRYAGPREVENNGVRRSILMAAVANLPDDPAQLLGKLHQLRTEISNADNAWHRGVAAELIRLKSEHWSAEACLTATAMWSTEMDGARDDRTFQKLAARAARIHPEQVLAALDQLPDAARSSFAGELIKQISDFDPDLCIALSGHLDTAQWDEALGRSLAWKADDYAQVIAALPAETTIGARRAFIEQWGEKDPETAAQWLESLPGDSASQPVAAGLAVTWASFDEEAATDWAAKLPDGPTHDGAAASLAKFFARAEPHEAWRWASSVADPDARAEAFYSVAYHWRSEAPQEFREAYAAARKAVELPVTQRGTDLFERRTNLNNSGTDPFK